VTLQILCCLVSYRRHKLAFPYQSRISLYYILKPVIWNALTSETLKFWGLPHGYESGRWTEDAVKETMAERILSSEKWRCLICSIRLYSDKPTSLIFYPEYCCKYSIPKRRRLSARLHRVTFQKTTIVTVITVRINNLTSYDAFIRRNLVYVTSHVCLDTNDCFDTGRNERMVRSLLPWWCRVSMNSEHFKAKMLERILFCCLLFPTA